MKQALITAALGILILTATCVAQPSTLTITQTVSASVSPLASIVSVPGTVTLTTGGVGFQSYTGSLTVTYRARTATGVNSNLTVQGNSDFSLSTGPRISNGNLTFTCGSATLGTACSGTKTMSMAGATSVVVLPSSACTGASPCSFNTPDPNQVVLSLSLANLPSYPVGAYSASITFTISAT